MAQLAMCKEPHKIISIFSEGLRPEEDWPWYIQSAEEKNTVL